MGPKPGKGKGKAEVPKKAEVVEEPEEESADEEIEEDEEMEEEDSDEDLEEGEDAELEISEAVNNAVQGIASLPTPDAVRSALGEVKEQIKTLLYTSTVGSMFKAVLESESPTKPFTEAEKEPARELFSRCSVTSHGVFRDDEWVLGPRRDVCGAATSIEIMTPSEEPEEIQITMVWYWRHDEEAGWVEEYSLTMDEEADAEQEAEDDSDASEPEVEVVTLVEGRRTQRGNASAEVAVEALRGLEERIQSGLGLRALLRFLVLATRTECEKTQGKPASISEGFDEEEDAEQMRRHLCAVHLDPEAPAAANPPKKRKAPPGAGKGAGNKAAKAKK